MDADNSDPHKRLGDLRNRLQMLKDDEAHMHESVDAQSLELSAHQEQIWLVRDKFAQTREELHEMRSFEHYDAIVRESDAHEQEEESIRNLVSLTHPFPPYATIAFSPYGTPHFLHVSTVSFSI